MAEASGPSGAGTGGGPNAATAPSDAGQTQSKSAPVAAVTPGAGQAESNQAAVQAPVQLPKVPSLPGVWDAEYHESQAEEGGDEAKQTTSETLADGAADKKEPAKAEETKPAFKFAGYEWESQEKAEQNYRTLRGQFKAMQTREAAAAATANQATTAALAWKAEADRLQAEADQNSGGEGRGERGQADGGTSDQAGEASPLSAIDWSLYQTLHDDHGPKVAAAWLYEQMLNAVDARVDGKIGSKVDPVLQPIQEREQHVEEANQLITAFQQAAQLRFEDGTPAYPELADGSAAEQVGLILTQLGLPPETAGSHMGIHLAVAVYRDRQARAGKLQSAQQSTNQSSNQGAKNPTAAEQAAAATAAANAAASGVVSGPQPPAVRPPANAAEGSEQAFRASIKNAGSFRPDLGFGE